MMRSNFQAVRYVVRQSWRPLIRLHHWLSRTTERISKGTVYQHTHFLRPAVNDDFHVKAEVLRFGKASAFTETRVSFASTGKLVAHASLEFAF